MQETNLGGAWSTLFHCGTELWGRWVMKKSLEQRAIAYERCGEQASCKSRVMDRIQFTSKYWRLTDVTPELLPKHV